MCFPQEVPRGTVDQETLISFRLRELPSEDEDNGGETEQPPPDPMNAIERILLQRPIAIVQYERILFPGLGEYGEPIIVMNMHYWCPRCIISSIRQGETWLHDYSGCINHPEGDETCMPCMHLERPCMPMEAINMGAMSSILARFAREARLDWLRSV
jgi:hypothetical protein